MDKINIEVCRLKHDFDKVFSGLGTNKWKDTLRDLRQIIHKYNRNGWLEHVDYYNTIKNKTKFFNYPKMRKFLKAQYKHTDYFRLEERISLWKERDVYTEILILWKKQLRSAMITYAELKKQHDLKVQHHRKTHLTQKVQCTCGKMISRGNILKHMNTKAHLQKVNESSEKRR